MRTLALLALLVLLGIVPTAGAADPVPAPLSSVPASPAADAPSRALPAAVTICRAGTSTRCWVRPGDDSCAPDGEPFRVVPDRAGEVASALAACRTPADAPAAPGRR